MFQQCNFVVHSASVTRKIAVGAYHPMARRDNADGVPSYSTTHSLCRHFWLLQRHALAHLFNTFSNIAIGYRLPEWNLTHDVRNHFTKRRQAVHTIGRNEIGLTTTEIYVQPTANICEHGRWDCFSRTDKTQQMLVFISRAFKPYARQCLAIRTHHKVVEALRRAIMLYVFHCHKNTQSLFWRLHIFLFLQNRNPLSTSKKQTP